MNEPTNKLFQDEPGYGAQGLGKWFASRLGARQALRNIFSSPRCECGEVKVLVWQRRCSFCGKGEGEMK